MVGSGTGRRQLAKVNEPFVTGRDLWIIHFYKNKCQFRKNASKVKAKRPLRPECSVTDYLGSQPGQLLEGGPGDGGTQVQVGTAKKTAVLLTP